MNARIKWLGESLLMFYKLPHRERTSWNQLELHTLCLTQKPQWVLQCWSRVILYCWLNLVA